MKLDVILTGAGFTHALGTPLAKEMRDKIYNSNYLENQQKIKKKFDAKDGNYEKVYADVVLSSQSKFSDEEKKSLEDAIVDAYKSIDRELYAFQDDQQKQKQAIQRFFGSWLYREQKHEHKVMFTLNQDLFIERHVLPQLGIPESNIVIKNHIESILRNKQYSKDKISNLENQLILNRYAAPYKVENHTKPLENRHLIDVSKEEDKQALGLNLENTAYYIKLHGSFDFINNQDRRIIISGKSKTGEIDKIFLLSEYLKLFESLLVDEQYETIRLIIIGYSFLDSHINDILENACAEMRGKIKIDIFSAVKSSELLKKTDEVIKASIDKYYETGFENNINHYIDQRYGETFKPLANKKESIF